MKHALFSNSLSVRRSLLFACVMALSSVTAQTLPTGATAGLFSIAENKQVYFSQGCLIHENDTWSFAEHQYELPANNALFAWGTSGYGKPDTIPSEQSIAYNPFKGSTYANFDWGVYNPISNGGNQAGLWRTLTREEWIYLFEHHTHNWTTIEGREGLKIMADDNVNFLFLPTTGKIGVEESQITDPTAGYYWTSIAGTDNKDCAEGYKITNSNIELMANANRREKMCVRLVYDTQAWITISDRKDNTELLNTYIKEGTGTHKGQLTDVHLVRTLYSDGWNTLCLPFDLTEDKFKAVFGEGCQLYTFSNATLSENKTELNINLTAASSITAGTPYIIQPATDIVNPDFYNCIIKVSQGNGETEIRDDNLQFVGIINPYQLTAGDKRYLFVTAGNELNWSKAGDNSSMYGMRAYFYVPGMQQSPISMAHTARLVIAPQAPTDINSPSGATIGDSRTSKYLRNGQIIIIHNGKQYNL